MNKQFQNVDQLNEFMSKLLVSHPKPVAKKDAKEGTIFDGTEYVGEFTIIKTGQVHASFNRKFVPAEELSRR